MPIRRLVIPFKQLAIPIGMGKSGKAEATLTFTTGLALWLKADAGLFKDAAKAQPATADADAVYTWADQSGNGRDDVQATLGNRPLLKLAIQNGLPCVLFDGSDDLMDTGAFTLNQPNTIFVVVKFATTNTYYGLIDSISTGFSYVGRRDDGRTELYAGVALVGPASGTGFILYEATFNGANSSIIVNGGTPTTGDAGMNAQVGVRLGKFENNTAPFSGYLGEVLIYNAALSDANRALVETYLNTRWAIY